MKIQLPTPVTILGLAAAAALLVPVSLVAGERGGWGAGAQSSRHGQRGGDFAQRLQRLDKDGDQALSFDELGEGRLFERADKNGDGRIERSEIPEDERAQKRFDRTDADRDGVVTKAEADAARRERFEAADANRDGELTADEARAAREARREEHAEQRFDAIDANDDGSVSYEEFAAHGGRARRLDADGDGRVSAGEIPEGERAQRMFERADADGDGAVTSAEMDAIRRKHFDKLDADHDGRLTREELEQARDQARERSQQRGGQRGRRS